jgi:very-short-patch-repair endonuclease
MIESFEELGFYKNEDYYHNSTFSELTKYCGGKRLRFDFMFVNHKRVFEFDGIQHFMPVRFGGISQEQAEENFRKQQEHDKLKDDFCKENGYKMVRISYKDYPNILSILHAELMNIMDNIG